MLPSLLQQRYGFFASCSIYSVKLICCIAFGLASSACCLLKFIAINLYFSLKHGQSSEQPVL